MEKSTIYGIMVFLLVVGGGYILAGEKSDTNSIISGNIIKDNNLQKVVIGMKNYNYYPNTIKVKSGIPVSISLDESVYGCFRDFTIREFGIHKYLKTPQESVEFIPDRKGTYTFACSMGMGSGKLIVE